MPVTFNKMIDEEKLPDIASLLPKLMVDSEAWHSCWMMLALFLEEKEDEGEREAKDGRRFLTLKWNR